MMRKYTFERRHYFFAFAFPPSKHPFTGKNVVACSMINDVAPILVSTCTTYALIDKMQNCIEIFMVMYIKHGFKNILLSRNILICDTIIKYFYLLYISSTNYCFASMKLNKMYIEIKNYLEIIKSKWGAKYTSYLVERISLLFAVVMKSLFDKVNNIIGIFMIHYINDNDGAKLPYFILLMRKSELFFFYWISIKLGTYRYQNLEI